MSWTVLVAFCIIDDLLKTLGHRDDPQSKTPASLVLTLWILAALAFAGKHKHALIYAKAQGLFSYIPFPTPRPGVAGADGCTACLTGYLTPAGL
ncbi:hypothetical protein [Meiothermus sp.]|uniref:hypothetical protein n=1 Tax=Meiothermus sp. TaxID=1955249 RepID=UPI00307F8BC4